MKFVEIRLLIRTLISCSLLASCSSTKGRIAPHQSREINAEVQKLIVTKNVSVFSGSVLIAQNGRPFVLQHYGWLDADSSSVIDDESRFNVGSMAKEIPSILILDLIQQGKISYEDTIDEFFDSLPMWSKRITIANLLFYESGLPPLNFSEIKNDDEAIEYLTRMINLPFDPGSNYMYSNWNNFILAKIVEKVCGVDFETWVTTEYFERLGINDSFYDSTTPDVAEDMTKSFSEQYGNDETGNPKFKRFKLCYGPLYMTTRDLLKWVEFVRAKHVIEDEDIVRFYRPTSTLKQGPLGVIEYQDGQLKAHKHGGFAYSYGTLTYRNYKNEVGIVLMTNRNRGNELQEIRDGILEILESDGLYLD
jgi:CubicO group peptidase (beta-lactamase class C family)